MTGMKESKTKWRALIKLVYSDIIPEKTGQVLCQEGEITELYPELLRHPDRVELLERLGYIERLPETPIVRPTKETRE